jgi:hypothetical protein
MSVRTLSSAFHSYHDLSILIVSLTTICMYPDSLDVDNLYCDPVYLMIFSHAMGSNLLVVNTRNSDKDAI